MSEGPDIQGVLDDYSRQHQPVDQSGEDGLNNMMAEAKQIMDAARIAGFTEEQAFRISLKYLVNMFKAVARVAMQG
jgi:hypothetical protein